MFTKLAHACGLALFPILVLASSLPSLAQEGVSYPEDIIYATTGQAVVFSHKQHVEDFGQGCTDCHSKIFEMQAYAARKNGNFDMANINEGKYCGACHNGKMAFSTDDFGQCAKCHSGAGGATEKAPKKIPGPAAPIKLGKGDSIAVFKHAAHDKAACVSCHTKLFPLANNSTAVTTMDEINKGKSCGQCHNGEKAFDAGQCGKCHPKM